MGLPARWNDPEHGVCLTLWAAVAHLKAQGVNCTPATRVIHCTLPGQTDMPTAVEAIYIPAAGWVFPLSLLEKVIPPPPTENAL